MARFPLYTDADVHGPLIEALRARGWDVLRAIDIFPEGTKDRPHFEYAAKENRVFVSNDQPLVVIANQWLAEGRTFRGLILWPQEHYKRMTYAKSSSSSRPCLSPSAIARSTSSRAGSGRLVVRRDWNGRGGYGEAPSRPGVQTRNTRAHGGGGEKEKLAGWTRLDAAV